MAVGGVRASAIEIRPICQGADAAPREAPTLVPPTMTQPINLAAVAVPEPVSLTAIRLIRGAVAVVVTPAVLTAIREILVAVQVATMPTHSMPVAGVDVREPAIPTETRPTYLAVAVVSQEAAQATMTKIIETSAVVPRAVQAEPVLRTVMVATLGGAGAAVART